MPRQVFKLYRPPWWLRRLRRLLHPQGKYPANSTKRWFHADELVAVWVPQWMRAAHQWYAEASGRFWRPCPLCGRPFGAHEWRSWAGKPDSVPDPISTMINGCAVRIGVCPKCTRKGRGVVEDESDFAHIPLSE